MEYLPNGLTLHIPEGSFPLSTDSMALAEFVKLPKNARVLDLGSGCGTLGLLLCSKDGSCHVIGIEISASAHHAALDNIQNNRLAHRLESINADARALRRSISPGSFSVCVANPPYFSGGPASSSLKDARREDTFSPEDLMQGAAWALKTGGDLFLVHRPEKLAQLITLGAREGLETKKLRLVRHRENGPVTLILLQLRKGARPGLVIEEAALHLADGQESVYHHKIYHQEEARHGRNVISCTDPDR